MGPFLYRENNATQEFVRKLDQELIEINNVLAIKRERKVTEEDRKKFAEADTCWICKGKFDIDIDEIERLETKIVRLKEKLKTFNKVTTEYNGIQTTIEKATKAIASKKAKADKDYDSHLVCESIGHLVNMHQIKTHHDYLRDLPPAVKNVAVGKDWLSPYNKELVNNLDGGCFFKTEKLVPHFGSRKDYVIHYLELQYYYVKLGMVVDEVSEILSFDQTNWLALYIAFNTEKCQGAKNAFEKDFSKLMNNSVYGKTMENVCKYQDIKLMKLNNEQDEKAFWKKVSSPRFKYGRLLGDTLVDAHMGKASVTLNKPIIIGASVLGLSKLHMYEFWYGYDIYKDMSEHPDLFDLNDSKTIGLFKDETPGVSKKGMEEMATDTYMPSLEGSLLDDPIDKSSLSEQEAMRADADPMTLFYRDFESKKKALCPIDTKCWILSDRITTLPYRYWRIQAYKNMVKDETSSDSDSSKPYYVISDEPTSSEKKISKAKCVKIKSGNKKAKPRRNQHKSARAVNFIIESDKLTSNGATGFITVKNIRQDRVESKMSSSSTLADRLEEYETERLINFLWGDSELSHIELGDGFFTRLEEENITRHLFLKLTRQEFREFGMGIGA
ncbi:hypothetical protein C1646_818951 [Rhizophagus diaphanus]|nr:hypothetical protein C1646_818951 [Rhizophagus diaphanus] [Rhizophagus sp. MUCL 43196]